MEFPPKRIDSQSVEYATYSKSHRRNYLVNFVRKITDDEEKTKRHAEALCVMCYYEKSRIGGAACSSRQCGAEGCKTILHSGNTCVDFLCLECARKLKLCKCCGADVDLKRRRHDRFAKVYLVDGKDS